MKSASSNLAEICGIHAGDGYLRNDGKRIELDISGAVEESDYYKKHVALLFQNYFHTSPHLRLFPSRNTYGFIIRDKKIVEFFHSLGFPYGNKSRIVRVPSFILDSKDKLLWCAFLRGLLDTDGHLGFRKYYGENYASFKTQNCVYPTICLTSVSLRLASDVQKLLDALDITYNFYTHTPRKSSEAPSSKITINGVSQLHRWMNLIGTKNYSKLFRYLIWQKFGFCPTGLTLEQRKGILKGKLSPYVKGP